MKGATGARREKNDAGCLRYKTRAGASRGWYGLKRSLSGASLRCRCKPLAVAALNKHTLHPCIRIDTCTHVHRSPRVGGERAGSQVEATTVAS